MRKVCFILFFFTFQSSATLYSQNLKLFDLKYIVREQGDTIAFVSMTDVYSYSDHPDSLVTPDLGDFKIEDATRFEYIPIDNSRRKWILERMGLKDSDRLFMYNYAMDKLIKLRVEDLELAASLTIYGADWPYVQNDYLIGFEIDMKYTRDFGSNYTQTIIYFGVKNPFITGGLVNIAWKEINKDQFPENMVGQHDTRYLSRNEYTIGKVFLYQNAHRNIYLQELVSEEEVFAKRLLITDKNSRSKRFETIYYSDESASFADETDQWTGRLFKSRPEVIFGFQWHSFGCPVINFIDEEKNFIVINCDNRH